MDQCRACRDKPFIRPPKTLVEGAFQEAQTICICDLIVDADSNNNNQQFIRPYMLARQEIYPNPFKQLKKLFLFLVRLYVFFSIFGCFKDTLKRTPKTLKTNQQMRS